MRNEREQVLPTRCSRRFGNDLDIRDRLRGRVRAAVIGALQRRSDRKRLSYAV